MRTSQRKPLTLAVVVALLLAVTVIAPAGAQTGPVDVTVTVHVPATATLDFDALVFSSDCAADDLTVPAGKLNDGVHAETYYTVAATDLCRMDLDVPAGWFLVEPYLPRVFVESATAATVWRLEPIPDDFTATLRFDVRTQAPPFAAAPFTSVTWKCADGFDGTFPVNEAMSFESTTTADSQILSHATRDIPAPPGYCSATFDGPLVVGYHTAGGIAVEAVEGETATLYFTGRVDTDLSYQCRGQSATMVGTDGDDVLIGTQGDDVIVAGPGNDRIQGRGGNDLICGDGGDDLLWGNGGDDELVGGPDNDILRGSRGNDTLTAGSGNDVADGAVDQSDRCVAEFTRRCES